MSGTHNSFVWYDLSTTDPAAAATFYTALLGWTVQENGDYWHLKNGDNGFGGLAATEAGAPVQWLGYVGTIDTKLTTGLLSALGAKTVVEPMEIPKVGTIAVVADPSGAAFALYQSPEAADSTWRPRRDQPGDVGWAEVTADDVEAAKTFYARAFGWITADPFGEPGHEYYMLDHDGQTFGGLMKRPEGAPSCAWTLYINVDDVDATTAQAKDLGGTVLYANTLPGIVQFAVLQDPQGAVFGVAKSLP